MKSIADKYIEFLEKMYDLKLYWYQKQWLKLIYQLPKNKREIKRFYNGVINFKNGSQITTIPSDKPIRGHRRKLPLYYDFECDKDELNEVLKPYIND